MSSKFWAGFEEIEAEEQRKMRQKARAARDARKKAEKRQQKQEKQKERAKAEHYYKKTDRVQTPPPTISDLRLKNLGLLGLRADQDNNVAVRSAFRRLALRYHPDKNPSPDAAETFKKIRSAYEMLL